MAIISSLVSVLVISEDVTDIVISVLIVISCDYSIIDCFYDTHNNAHFHWKNQKPEGRYNIGTYL